MIPCPVCTEELSQPPQNFGSAWTCWTCAFEIEARTMDSVRFSVCAGDDCLTVIVPFAGEGLPHYLCVICRSSAE